MPDYSTSRNMKQYFSKYWRNESMGRPPPQILGHRLSSPPPKSPLMDQPISVQNENKSLAIVCLDQRSRRPAPHELDSNLLQTF